MSHVSALPAASSPSVLEETATEATQYAIATLSSFPYAFERLDALDATVGAVGFAAAARVLYKAYTSGAISTALQWLPLLGRCRRAKAP